MNSIEKILHWIAGCGLFLFSFLHVMHLVTNDALLMEANIVFPFVTNKGLVITVAILEFLVAVICLKYAAHNATNAAILLFIGIIIWYRWAFHFTGGRDCSCTGILGKVLHLSKRAENAIPIMTLIFIFGSTCPWLYKLMVGKKANKLVIFTIGMVIVGWPPLRAQEIVEIQGIYTIECFERPLHTPIEGSRQQVNFTARLSGNSWNIRSEGIGLNGSNTWEALMHDGTNSYYTCPTVDHISGSSLDSAKHFASIIPGENFNIAVISDLDIYFPWLVFGLSSQAVEKSEGHSKPLPWRQPRSNLLNYGYKWNVTALENGRFIKDCVFVRDQKLDLDDENELLRPEIDYPSSLEEKLTSMKRIQIRRAIPTGFIHARYSCSDWFATNQMFIPRAATLFRYEYSPNIKYATSVVYQAQLAVTNLAILQVASLLHPPSATTLVYDYRYRTNDSSRIYFSADYTLQSNEAWKGPNDKVLLQKASDWLKHGKKYNEISKKRNYVAWAILFATLAPVFAYLIWLVKNKKNKE